MKNILVPTDFSELGNAALDMAVILAKKTGSDITLLHIIESNHDYAFNVEGEVLPSGVEESIYTIELIRKAKLDMLSLLSKPEYDGINLRSALKIGSVYYGIKDYIANHQIDLVVIGTAGSSSMTESLLGSTADKLLRLAQCPLLTIHKPIRGFNIDDIVMATTMQKEEAGIAAIVKTLQNLLDAKVHLVRVNTPNNFSCDTDIFEGLEKFAAQQQLENVTYNVFNDISEEKGIVNFAKRIKADLIAMSTHGRTGIAHLFSGSIAESVVGHTEKPVLTLVSKDSD